jgi:N-acyl-phosphatidylethanolamine-hydrolysing phospholipase D
MEKDVFKKLCPKKNGRYVNPHIPDQGFGIWDAFLWKLGFFDDVCEQKQMEASFVYPQLIDTFDKDKPSVTWINHDSFLIKYAGIHLLTDPIWSKRCSPLSFMGPKRCHAPPMTIEELPRIDFVLISHNHYDHLDKPSVKKLFRAHPDIQWIVPQGLKHWFFKQGISKVIELSWWEQTHPSSPISLKVTAVPAQHYSRRGLWDKNKSLWVGWVIEFDKSKTLYFTGDTGYNPIHFKEIGNRWRAIDLSLIPIGCYVPRKFMSAVHVDPDEAVAIHQDTGSKLSIAMHWKTFQLGDEKLHQPPYDLYLALQKASLDPTTFRVLEPGYALNW